MLQKVFVNKENRNRNKCDTFLKTIRSTVIPRSTTNSSNLQIYWCGLDSSSDVSYIPEKFETGYENTINNIIKSMLGSNMSEVYSFYFTSVDTQSLIIILMV